MTPSERLIELTDEGRALLARERACLLSGDYAQVEKLTGQKQGLLDALDGVIGKVSASDPVRKAMNALIADSRRNEEIILAVRQGLQSARRRIEAIVATGRGRVAYDRDGAAITSRDDAVQKSRRA